MAAIVVGGRIVNAPQNDLSGILGGVGDILNAIGIQKQESTDRAKLTELNRVLAGDTLPSDQAGPVSPGLTDPRERFRTIASAIPQLKRPGNQALALELAKNEAKTIPTGASSDPLVSAIFTDASGVERKIKAKTSTIARSPNLDFPKAGQDTPSQFEIVTDTLGNQFRVDKLNPSNPPVPIDLNGSDKVKSVSDVKVSPIPRNPAVTLEVLNNANGPASAIRQSFNNLFGFAIPGQIAPKTESAKVTMRLFNQKAKDALLINPRGPKFEQEIINKALIDPDKALTDPDANPVKMLAFRGLIERRIQGNQEAINGGNITKKQVQDFTDQNNLMGQVLRDIPTKDVLDRSIGNRVLLTREQVTSMSVTELKTKLSSLSIEELNRIPKEVKLQLQRKLNE